MLSNNKYNKNKILHDLSCICWFIDKHAIDEAKKENDAECIQKLQSLKQDLDKHIAAFDKCICEKCACGKK